ncbi:MAG: tRNA preQ1(34) S-adenosylmethionine ribosyltransferase-isomerase QueA [Bdellovibrionales bacterium]|nr:tRNA preQ1(34) S-adenosylmethionine ribosyltransferase-isomerase QueA [Bdellovibrionales bacterium]
MSELTNLSAYDFHLPENQIAQFPQFPRDRSRLLVVHRANGRIEHRSFQDLPEYLDANDLLIANNTRVMKARLPGVRILSKEGEPRELGGKIEMLLLERPSAEDLARLGAHAGDGYAYWQGIFNSAARQLAGFRFGIPRGNGDYLEGELVRGAKESPNGTVIARFREDPVTAGVGELPLPHYIKSKAESDERSYQTVYAKELGSAAAPTAGLHFTEDVLAAVKARGACWEEVTLHVGLGTFRPVKTEDIRGHHMHEERYAVSTATADALTRHRAAGGRVLAIGTTSVRTLESIYDGDAKAYRAGESATSIFIYPGGREIRAVDRLLTNFHLPKSTLLMLVSAFGGRDLMLRAYAEAVEKGYRFFSYGDAMLIL